MATSGKRDSDLMMMLTVNGHYDDAQAKIKSDHGDGDDQEVESLMMPSTIQLPMATTASSRKVTVKISILIHTFHPPLTSYHLPIVLLSGNSTFLLGGWTCGIWELQESQKQLIVML